MNILTTTKETTLLFQNDFIKITFEKKISLLSVEWRRQITFAERVIGYENAFKFMKELKVEAFLVNNEKLFIFSTLEKDWLAEVLQKWVTETNIKKFALITSDMYKNMTDLADYIRAMKNTSIMLKQIEHEFFIDVETARLWLCPNEETLIELSA